MTPPGVSKAERREWVGLAAIALPCLLYGMDLTVLNLALPSLSLDLEPSSSELLWIVDIYGFVVAGSLITMGTLGDRIRRRRLLLIGGAAFGVTSVVSAFSTSPGMLIAARALLGASGATLHRPRSRSSGTCSSILGSGPWRVVRQLLGGGRLRSHRRRAPARAFLVGVGVPARRAGDGAPAPAGLRLLPESRDLDIGRLDPLSAALSLGVVLAVIYGLKRAAEEGLSSVASLLSRSGSWVASRSCVDN